MRAVELNLARDPFRNHLPWAVLLSVLGVLAFGLSAWNGWGYLSARLEGAALERGLEEHHQQMTAMRSEAETINAALRKVDQRQLASQSEFVGGILARRNFSWTGLFNTLEDVLAWNVRMTQVRPVFSGESVEIEMVGVARDPEALLAFQDRLLKAPEFPHVYPSGFAKEQDGDQVSFTLRIGYLPEVAAAERVRRRGTRDAEEAADKAAEQAAEREVAAAAAAFAKPAARPATAATRPTAPAARPAGAPAPSAPGAGRTPAPGGGR